MINVKELMKKNAMLIALVVIMILFQALIVSADKGSLFAPTNMTNLISQNSYVVILATGMLLCIITGGNIDLSVGSVVALIGAIAGTLIVNMGMGIGPSIVICLFTGILIGAWQGYWIAYVRIPAFIVTLAGMLMFRGIALIILQGVTISPFPKEYTNLFNSFIPGTGSANTAIISLAIAISVCIAFAGIQVWTRVHKKSKGYAVEPIAFMVTKIAIISAVILAIFWLLGQDKGVPVVLILLAVVVMSYYYFTSKTVPGRRLYAMGGNEKAAKLSGINTNRMLFAAYVNMGFLAALAALVCVARFNSATPSAGTNYELDAIGACFIGGASAYGGVGTVGGAVIGAIFMGVLNNGMSILGIDANWQRAVKGLVLLLAVIFDILSKKRKQTA